MQLNKQMLNELFEYRDGEIYYKVSRSRNKAGSKAGTYRKHDNAYQVIIGGKHYLVHRVVFMLHHGYMPEMVDHIDGNRANNKIENLRQADVNQNAQNAVKRKDNTSGVKGVNWSKVDKCWRVRVQCKNKRIDFGGYQDLEFADLVSQMAREKYHGAYANHGTTLPRPTEEQLA